MSTSINSKDDTTQPTLLVIGGGIAGLLSIANFRKLDTDAKTRIIMIEPKDYCEIGWVTYRSPFDEKIAHDSILPLEAWCTYHNVIHKRTTVTKLTETEATLQTGEVIPFTIAVICVGATAPWRGLGRGPLDFTKSQRMEQLKEEGSKLLEASSVCIVGGGLIGCELAGDLVDYATDVKKTPNVTLVHNGPHLCSADCTKGCGDMIQSKLEKLGVTVVINEKAQEIEDDGGYKKMKKIKLFNSGKEIQAEQIVMTVGVQSVMKNLLDDENAKKFLNERGWIIVDDTFRVVGSNTLMAVGDCCNFLMNAANQLFINKDKIAYNIQQVLQENLNTSAKGEGAATKLKHGFPMEFAKVTTVGRNDGVAQLPMGLYTQYMLPAFKNKTLFMDNFTAIANIPPPPAGGESSSSKKKKSLILAGIVSVVAVGTALYMNKQQ